MAPTYPYAMSYDLKSEIKREDCWDLQDLSMERSDSWDSGCYPGTNSTISSPVNGFMDYSDNSYAWNGGGQDGSYSQNQFTSPSQGYSGGYVDMGSSSHQEYPNQERKYVCLHAGCTARPFGRSADLDRHLKQVHAEESHKDKFFCDYKRCLRKDGAFGRKDHFRDHFRDYHKEDILQRGKTATRDWRETRNINLEWWRCSKCLNRIEVAVSGYECPDCRFLCETDRQRLRSDKMRGQQARR